MVQFLSPRPHKTPGPCFAMAIVVLAAYGMLIVPTGAASSQGNKPDFSGHWVLDKAQSDLGPGPKVDDVTEDIQHHEPVLIITTIAKDAGGENKRTVRYTTDGAPNTNQAAGHEMKTTTRWEGDTLVTVVRDEAGLELTESRSLSNDGKTQTVETNFGMGKQKLLMVRK